MKNMNTEHLKKTCPACARKREVMELEKAYEEEVKKISARNEKFKELDELEKAYEEEAKERAYQIWQKRNPRI